ncbi:hypothetical protein HYE68_008797 [Fusarium pseudograminearum]|nr:hypothetical protein HYE68_008797 [Fusarium pseudograminearum]
MIDSGLSDQGVSWGLHRASIELRDRWVKGHKRERSSLERAVRVLRNDNSNVAADSTYCKDESGRDIVMIEDDEPEVGEQLQRLTDSLRVSLDGAPEWPRLRSLIPKLKGLDVLDLGCGFGWFARWARSTGANSVRAIEIYTNMLSRARVMTNDTNIIYEQADLNNVRLSEYGSEIYDVVFSSLTLHNLANLPGLIEQVQTVIKPRGTFVFSIEHPIYTAPTKPEFITDTVSGREYWPLDSYQKEGLRVTDWLAKGVQKQHRTVASYINLLLKAGFQIAEFDEWCPTPEEMEKCGWQKYWKDRFIF